jgi:hypothetical protein
VGHFWIVSSCEVIGEYCFYACKSLVSVAFDAGIKILRFDCDAFSCSGLTSIHILSSIDVICEGFFSQFAFLASVTFDPDTTISRFD